MWYVYILESVNIPGRFYTGFSRDWKRRIKEHNAENNTGYTAKFAPWKLHSYFAFTNELTARDFENYLKTRAGRRFQKLRFIKNG